MKNNIKVINLSSGKRESLPEESLELLVILIRESACGGPEEEVATRRKVEQSLLEKHSGAEFLQIQESGPKENNTVKLEGRFYKKKK